MYVLYAQVPPPGPLTMVAELYRPVMGAICILLTIIVRYGLATGMCIFCRAAGLPGWKAVDLVHSKKA